MKFSKLAVLALWSLAIIGIAFPPHLAAGEAADIAVVVRPDTPVESLSLAEARKLLLGDRQYWNSNMRVTLLIRAPTSHERDVVLKTIYRMSEGQYRQYWISKVFRAESSNGPRVVYSNSMADELVQAIPGSVAFIDAKEVPRGLKVLKIDGALPGDASYPLK
jgi:hypothetical protein